MKEERASYRWLDLVRALAAIAVLWQHCFDRFGGPTAVGGQVIRFTASFGRDAVLVFFVISGFWISHSVHSSVNDGRWHWSSYFINRLSRLWVVLIPALAVGGALDLVGRLSLYPEFYRSLLIDGSQRVDVLSHLGSMQLIGNMFFLQLIAVPTWGSNGPLWSLACEFWYYVTYPALVVFLRGPRSVLGLGLLTLAMAIALISRTPTLLFGAWLLGALVRYVAARHSPPAFREGRARFAVLFSGLAVMTLSGVLSRIHPIEANWFLSSYVVAAGFSVLLLAVLWSEPKFPDFLAPAQKFGAAASFSLYAIHLPIVTFLAAFAAKYVTSTSPNVSLALALGATILMIPGSWMFAAQTEARTSQFREFLRKCARRLNHSKSRGQAGAH